MLPVETSVPNNVSPSRGQILNLQYWGSAVLASSPCCIPLALGLCLAMAELALWSIFSREGFLPQCQCAPAPPADSVNKVHGQGGQTHPGSHPRRREDTCSSQHVNPSGLSWDPGVPKVPAVPTGVSRVHWAYRDGSEDTLQPYEAV